MAPSVRGTAGEAASSILASSPGSAHGNPDRSGSLSERSGSAGQAALEAQGPPRSSRGCGGVPRRTHSPSSRRSISPRAMSWPSAVVTDGRRAPTMPASVRCDSRRETTTPSGTTRPQRSARHHRSASSRSSTRVRCAMAWSTTRRSARRAARSSSAAKTSGHCAARTASPRSITATRVGASAVQPIVRGRSSSCSSSSQARTTSPGPSSSAAGWSPTVASRSRRPSRTSRAIGWLPRCRLGRPAPALDVRDPRVEALRRLAGATGIEIVGEIGVDVEKLDRPAATKFWHAGSFRFGEVSWTPTGPGRPLPGSPAARMGSKQSNRSACSRRGVARDATQCSVVI